ncbi:MAG: hypothetical protein DRP87_19760 [Spirochaetes bacterium]|nr:MAG: hypothetical protein DRP87_19760 [Spirochaetota bacterium]
MCIRILVDDNGFYLFKENKMIRKYSRLIWIIFTWIIFFILPLPAQEGGKLSFQVTPGVNLPMGASTREMFTIGGGAELVGAYSMPFLPILFVRGSVGYSLLPTMAQKNLSMITFGGGVGISFNPIPVLNLHASGTGGYGLGIYSGRTGGSAYVSGEGGVAFFFVPAFGLGAGTSYRYYFSQPTAFYQGLRVNLGAVIRLGAGAGKANIELPEIRFDPVFPVFYKHYDDHPVGKIKILNKEKGTIRNVKVSFFVNQYMDKPKQCAIIKEMKKGEEMEVPLYALFNDRVMSITEGTKVTADITIEYQYAKSDMAMEKSETLRLYDRNAMTWDDDRKAAAFITAKDPEILKFSKSIAGVVREHGSKAVNLNFRIAMGLFEGLGMYGVNYVIDPQTPYTEFSKDKLALDYLQFPVQTLSYKAGDCDDLSILYSAMLESTGIETAFITVPGHIYMAFSLGMTPEEADKIFLNPGDLIYRGDNAWAPVEITMVQDGFLKAWETGAREWRENDSPGKARFYPIHEAWKEYEPVGLPAAGIAVSPLDERKILNRFTRSINRLVEREIADKVAEFNERIAESNNNPRLVNKLGVLYARYGLLDKAREHFARNLLSWRHSRGSIDNSVRILDERSLENLARYMARPPISLKKIHYEGFKGKALFHTNYKQWSIATRAGPCFSKLIFEFSRVGRRAGCVLLPGSCRSFLVYFSRVFRFEGL